MATCPDCGALVGEIFSQSWNDARTRTVMTRQARCFKGHMVGEPVEFTDAERAAINAEADAGSVIGSGSTAVHLKDLPTAARRKALQQLQGAKK